MEKVTLNVENRKNIGKGNARSMRREDKLPAVMYRAGGSSALTLDASQMKWFIRKTAGEKVILNLQFPDNSNKFALLKEFQIDPIRGNLLHVDFYELAMDEIVRARVPLKTHGVPIGVRRDKGLLEHVVREVEIECLPDKMPGHIDLDITTLLSGHSIHIRDLAAIDGVKVISDPNEVLCMVTAVTETEAATTDQAPEAPEVIKKGKKEAEA